MEVKEKQGRSLLRFTTAGSVDDGKSTLIGRLLYDSKSIFEDQLEHIEQSGKRLGRSELDLSLLTDGLRAEREQGITIDVAYRYFATPARKFIIADTPGHIQYTRNMVTGASTADVALILVDARKGVLEQTIRHTYIASLLDIRHIIFCINKMDLVNWSETEFRSIKTDLESLAAKLAIEDASFIPMSAKYGDNVVHGSRYMSWYPGLPLLSLLENIVIKRKNNENPRFPVQTVIRTDNSKFPDHRAYAGKVAGGSFRSGDTVKILPSMIESRIKNIYDADTQIEECFEGDCVSLVLEDHIDISRGDMLASVSDMPKASREIEVLVCWFNNRPLNTGGKYLIRLNNQDVTCVIRSVNYKININNLEKDLSDPTVKMNDIANISITCSKTVFFDSYKVNNSTGSLIFVDETTNETAGAGMII